MAQTWEEYFGGTPQQAAADAVSREQDFRRVAASPAFRELRGMEPWYDQELGRTVDPREVRMAMMVDTLPQHRMKTTDAGRDAVAAINYGLAAGQRARDTALRGVQELAQGNAMQAAALAARSPVSVFYPPAAAGTPGSPDDWRPRAVAAGVPESHVLAFDFVTDPETWITAPVRGPLALAVPALQYRALRATANSDAALRAIQAGRKTVDRMRYGAGIPTFLEDAAGNVIRRVPNSQPATESFAPLLLR